MSLFLPFAQSHSLQTIKICQLCDLPAAYTAFLRIRCFDPDSNKLVATEIDMSVCEKHALTMDVQIEKTIKAEKRTLIIFMP